VLTVISQHGHPVFIAIIGLTVAAVAATIFHFVSKGKKKALR
jgi:hypothetical protein